MSKIFEIMDGLTIHCRTTDNQDGFKHVAVLKKGGKVLRTSQIQYINRTWEQYDYQSVIKQLLRKATELTEAEKKEALDIIEGRQKEARDSMFKSVAMVATMGELLCDNQKEKNDWKKRMLKAGLPHLSIPDDWDELSEDEKEKRLNKVIALARQSS